MTHPCAVIERVPLVTPQMGEVQADMSARVPSEELDGLESALRQARARGRIRGVLALLGPAFVASVAYVDPGNFATNVAAGATFGYSLAWWD